MLPQLFNSGVLYNITFLLFPSFFVFNETLILVTFLLTPIFFSIVLMFIRNNDLYLLKNISLFCTLILFIISIFLWLGFDNLCFTFQYTVYLNWFTLNNINYCLGIDGISFPFIILTTFLMPLCVLISWNSINYRFKEFVIFLLIIEFFLLNIFCSLDIFMFYIYFESILMPMFLLIGIWGSRERKVHAAFQFFIYTFLGSIFMLFGILIIYFNLGTTDLQIFLNSFFSKNKQIILWLSFFISFAFKVPMIPFHIWLPEAHVEAPTAGSVLLAGVLLKLGTYGMLRFLMSVFSYANYFFTPLIFTLSLIGVLYSSCTTIRQIDLKKIIAYSSVAHMNFALIGLFSINIYSLSGSVFLMLSHGIVSGALFLCVGILYDRYHTRLLKYYGGLAQYMPIFSFFFFTIYYGKYSFSGNY